MAVVVDGRATPRKRLRLEPDLRPARAQPDGDTAHRRTLEPGLGEARPSQDRLRRGRVGLERLDAVLHGASEHDGVTARDDVGDPTFDGLVEREALERDRLEVDELPAGGEDERVTREAS